MTVHAEVVDGVLTGVRKNFSFPPEGYPVGVEWLPIEVDADPPGNDDTHKIVVTPRMAGGAVRDEKARVPRTPDEVQERIRRATIEDPSDAIAVIVNEIVSDTRTPEFQVLLDRLKVINPSI